MYALIRVRKHKMLDSDAVDLIVESEAALLLMEFVRITEERLEHLRRIGLVCTLETVSKGRPPPIAMREPERCKDCGQDKNPSAMPPAARVGFWIQELLGKGFEELSERPTVRSSR
jgi:hypothetical protein